MQLRASRCSEAGHEIPKLACWESGAHKQAIRLFQ